MSNTGKNDNPFGTKLWTAMMKVFERIIQDPNDAKGWDWLEENVLSSIIWYLPHPVKTTTSDMKMDEKKDDFDDNDDEIMKKTLYWELLRRVRKEIIKQSDTIIRHTMDKIRTSQTRQWSLLKTYKISTKYQSVRQDTAGVIAPRFGDRDLENFKTSSNFKAKSEYDTNLYLNQLLFRANILDNLFQTEMKSVTKLIKHKNAMDITYRAGPVKTLESAQRKIANDLINEKYPKSAGLLDLIRCTIQFKNIPDMMKYLEMLTTKIKKREAGCLKDILRCKNGWTILDPKSPKYTDIKVNVLVQHHQHQTIKMIAEIKFSLDFMEDYVKITGPLYRIQQKFKVTCSEFIYSF